MDSASAPEVSSILENEIINLLLLLAAYSLTLPDGRAQAIRYLDQALELNHRTSDVYYWCKLMRMKLEDPDWPAKLKALAE